MDLGHPDTPRWVQRFANFDRALVLLREGIELAYAPSARPILLEALIQRFEYTWELGWKTLKDFLEFEKVTLDRITAKEVIRTAFAAKFIKDGETWMAALDARNAMAHMYNQKAFESVAMAVRDRYIAAFEDLHDMLANERVKLDSMS